MTNRTIIIKTDGSKQVTEYKDGGRPTLEELQKAVGGYIETVSHFDEYDGEAAVMFCDEEGKLKDKPINPDASALWWKAMGTSMGDVLCGDCIILVGTKEFVYGDDDGSDYDED